MPVPSSGELRLRADINQEINGNNTDTNVSLGTLSNEAGFTEPDNMSDFYGYSACGTPTFGSASAGANPNGQITAQSILYTNGPSCTVTGCGLYVGTTTNRANATKYTTATSWGIYQWKYFTLNGFTNGQTYYVWIWAYNGVNEGVSSMYTVTVPAAYVPVTNVSVSGYGDFSGANYCPNFNFNGGLYVVFTNTTSTTTLDVYGDGNFYHASSQQYNGCIYTYGAWPAQSAARQVYTSLNGTCYDYSQCGTTRTIYGKFKSSGYTDRIYSVSRACPAC